jgi:hypothetical protein
MRQPGEILPVMCPNADACGQVPGCVEITLVLRARQTECGGANRARPTRKAAPVVAAGSDDQAMLSRWTAIESGCLLRP